MLTIICDKCGMKNSNPYSFDNSRYSFIGSNNYLKIIHLCSDCKRELNKELDIALANFLVEEKIRDWSKHEGIE